MTKKKATRTHPQRVAPIVKIPQTIVVYLRAANHWENFQFLKGGDGLKGFISYLQIFFIYQDMHYQ